jgi:hypothetical protein
MRRLGPCNPVMMPILTLNSLTDDPDLPRPRPKGQLCCHCGGIYHTQKGTYIVLSTIR